MVQLKLKPINLPMGNVGKKPRHQDTQCRKETSATEQYAPLWVAFHLQYQYAPLWVAEQLELEVDKLCTNTRNL